MSHVPDLSESPRRASLACSVSLGMGALLIAMSLTAACGKTSKDTPAEPATATKQVVVAGPKVTVTVPVKVYVTVSPDVDSLDVETPPPEAKFWVASNAFRYLSAYSEGGELVKSLDLATLVNAPITAMSFVDRNTLLLFLDPGASGEVVARLDVETGVVTPGFIVDPAFANSVVQHMAVVPPSQLYLARQGGGVERMHVDLAHGNVTRFTGLWPLVNTVNCPATTYQLTIPYEFGGTKGIAMFSSGANLRVNVWNSLEGTPACGTTTSTNIGAGGINPSAAGFTPVGAYYDGTKFYVRYHHATTPKIVRYDFNGQMLSNGTDVVMNPGLLSTVIGSRDLTPLDSTRMLVPEWTSDTIHTFNVNGTYEGVFARNSFTTDVNAIAIRPSP